MTTRAKTIVGLLLSLIGTWLLVLGGCGGGGEMRILDVAPRVGSTQGQQTVQIVGQNFRQDIGYTIYFGTKRTTAVTIRDPETMEITTPSGMPEGKVDIMIRSDDGSAHRIADVFTFLAPPTGTGGAPEQKAKGNLAY